MADYIVYQRIGCNKKDFVQTESFFVFFGEGTGTQKKYKKLCFLKKS